MALAVRSMRRLDCGGASQGTCSFENDCLILRATRLLATWRQVGDAGRLFFFFLEIGADCATLSARSSGRRCVRTASINELAFKLQLNLTRSSRMSIGGLLQHVTLTASTLQCKKRANQKFQLMSFIK